MNKDRQHRKVHQKDLHKKRRAAEKAHPDRHGPAHAVVKNRFPGIVARGSHAGHAEKHAEHHAADDAGYGELDRHGGAFDKKRPVFGKNV